ncbi:hypothetical protein YK56LOC_60060 [Caballeronia sp. HLA56]
MRAEHAHATVRDPRFARHEQAKSATNVYREVSWSKFRQILGNAAQSGMLILVVISSAIVLGTLPYIFVMMAVLALIGVFPSLSTMLLGAG